VLFVSGSQQQMAPTPATMPPKEATSSGAAHVTTLYPTQPPDAHYPQGGSLTGGGQTGDGQIKAGGTYSSTGGGGEVQRGRKRRGSGIIVA